MGPVSPLAILFFYLSCFGISFFLCIPIGPVNLEVFHKAIKKDYVHAISTAFGAAMGDAVWAMAAFYGITPFLKNGYNIHMEGIFLLATASITFVLGVIALKDARLKGKFEKREEEIIQRIQKKRWSVLKGLLMVLVNPLGIASWMIALSFLKKLKIYIPLRLTYEVIFFVVVILGAVSYFTTIVLITNKMKDLFNPARTVRIVKCLGYLLVLFSIYFLFFAIKALFFK